MTTEEWLLDFQFRQAMWPRLAEQAIAENPVLAEFWYECAYCDGQLVEVEPYETAICRACHEKHHWNDDDAMWV